MSNKTCTETYLRNGRLMAIENQRPSGHGPWPRSQVFLQSELVVRIIDTPEGPDFAKYGPASTRKLVADSLAIHRGMPLENIDSRVWQEIPPDLVRNIEERIENRTSEIERNWYRFSNEEARTGALFSGASGVVDGPHGWVATFEFVEFSKQTKEGHTGADVALIFDVLSGDGRRAFKTLWIQAKVAEERYVALDKLPRFPNQLTQMRSYTQQSFGLLYTPKNTVMVGPGTPNGGIEFHAVIAQSLRCRWGDPSSVLYAQSLNRLKIFQVLVTQQ